MKKILVLIPGMLGAGCTSVAYELARRLGLEVVNSERIIREIVEEKRVSYAELALMARDGEIDLEGVIRGVAVDYANEGNVIIEGRTAFMVLDREATLKVFLYADKNVRAERVAKRRGITLEEALEEVERSDEDRNRLTERLYKKSFTDPSLYDVILDTTKMAYEEVAQVIENLVRHKMGE